MMDIYIVHGWMDCAPGPPTSVKGAARASGCFYQASPTFHKEKLPSS